MYSIYIYGRCDKRPLILSLCYWIRKIGDVIIVTDNPMYIKSGVNSCINDVDIFYIKNMDEIERIKKMEGNEYVIYDYFDVMPNTDAEFVVCINDVDESEINAEKILKINYEMNSSEKNKSIIIVKPEFEHFKLATKIIKDENLIQFNYKDILKASAAVVNLIMPSLKTKLIYDDMRKDV